ncbi:hypothetical protein [Nonomuraea sp. CA-141351]|uniref:hypothetical protein n=1 Tax=Nonomuraea sp. CA-141351 TaxID=3239996 RepID=UPI003D9059B5
MRGGGWRQGFEGIKAAHRVRATHPVVGVVVLSQYSDALLHRRVAVVLSYLGLG